MARKRERASAEGLLPRMEARPWSDNKTVTYRYHPADGSKPINLGTDKMAAIRQVLDMNGQADTMGTLKWVWEKFQESPRWLKLVEGTQDDYRGAWKQLNAVLGDMQISRIDSPMVARYVRVERAKSPRRADIEKSLLSRLFGHGIKLGVCQVNATIGVEPHGGEPRTEAPPPEVLAKFLDWVSQQTPQRRIIGMAAEYASLAGNRKVEFLDLCWPQIQRPGKQIRDQILAGQLEQTLGAIRVKRAKQRGKKRGEVIEVIEISPLLNDLIDRLASLRDERGVDCLYVFPTRDNNAYTAKGFKTLWQRCMTAAIKQQVISKESRFTFHDLRAYYASVHKTQHGSLPDLHKDTGTTARVYDRNKEVKRRAL